MRWSWRADKEADPGHRRWSSARARRRLLRIPESSGARRIQAPSSVTAILADSLVGSPEFLQRASEASSDDRAARIQRGRLSIRSLRRIEPTGVFLLEPLLQQRAGAIVTHRRETHARTLLVRLQTKHLAITGCRIVHPPETLECGTEVVMRLGIIGFEPDRLFELELCLVDAIARRVTFEKDGCQVVPRKPRRRIGGDRRAYNPVCTFGRQATLRLGVKLSQSVLYPFVPLVS